MIKHGVQLYAKIRNTSLNIPKYLFLRGIGRISTELRNEFESATVNE